MRGEGVILILAGRILHARRSRKRVNRQDIDDLAQPVHTDDHEEGKHEEAAS